MKMQSPSGHKLIDSWKKARQQRFAGIILGALGAVLIITALFLSVYKQLLLPTGLAALVLCVLLIVKSHKTWSSDAAECSMEFEDDSALRLTALNILLQNPTMVLTGYRNLLLIFTSVRAFILPLSSSSETQQAAENLKDQVQQSFNNVWQNVELVEPATNVDEIERQCDRITSDFCQERISDELAGNAWQFSLQAGKIIMFGRPLPNLPTPAILAGDTSKDEKSKGTKKRKPTPIQFKNVAAIVLIVVVVFTGIRLINRIRSSSSPESPAISSPAPEIPEIPLVVEEEAVSPTETTDQQENETDESEVSGPLSPPSDIKVAEQTESSIRLTWSKSNNYIRGYEILRNGRLIARTRNDYYVDRRLQPDTRYTYTIRAYDESRKKSESSAPIAGQTKKDNINPTTPSNLRVSNNAHGVQLHWSASRDNVDVWGYDIYRDGRKVGNSTRTNFTDKLTSEGTYDYTVRAFDRSKNYSGDSNKVSITITDSTPPSVPRNIVAGQTIDSIRLSWAASSDNKRVSGYEIYRDGRKVGNTSSTNFTDSGLKPETTYSYTIKAIDSSNNYSRSSETIAIKTSGDNRPPAVPSNLKAVGKTSSTVQLTWSPSSDNVKVEKYEIYRDNTPVGFSESTSFSDKGLVQSVTYTYKIKAIDAYGNSSGFSPAIEVETEKSTVTIYYKGFPTPHIHYKKSNGLWTTSPGVALPNAEINGYFKITIPMGYLDEIIACFNDGKGIWDSNGGANYRFKEGVWTFENGKITPGAP